LNAPVPSSWRTALPWPLTVIDFEASSLDQDGYPIEVGLALWPGPDDAIFGWSTLIQPAGDWSRHGHWSLKSAKVHGILGRELLADGQPPGRIAAALNEVLGNGTIAWCDGDAYDVHWSGALFKAANIARFSASATGIGSWPCSAQRCGTAAWAGWNRRRRDTGRVRMPSSFCSPWPMRPGSRPVPFKTLPNVGPRLRRWPRRAGYRLARQRQRQRRETGQGRVCDMRGKGPKWNSMDSDH